MPISALIPANWSSFPDVFRARLGNSVGRQRVMVSDGHLLIVAHMVPDHDEAGRRGVLFWKDDQAEWRCSNGDPGKVAIGLHLDRFSKKLEHFEGAETIAQSPDDYLHLLEGLAPVVRSCRNLLETMEEARKSAPDDRSLIDHRDKAYDLSRQAELLYEDAKNSMDVAVIRRADEQAQATQQMTIAAHRLNTLAAIFFPFATLGAVFGTTLTDNWSWSQSVVPFVLFIVMGLIAGLVLAQYIVRPAKKL